MKLQEHIDRLGCWARKWCMRFKSVKCNTMQITRKRIKKVNASYNLEGTVLDNVENIKYLGVTITNDLKWNTHVSNICTKANRTLGFLRRNLLACRRTLLSRHIKDWCAHEHIWHSRTTTVGISEKRRRDSRIILLYKGLKGAASIPTNDTPLPTPHAPP